jgi:hypothetical protein
MLTESQFQTVYGSGWILADGRDVSGSAYHTLTGRVTVADLRGVFLRAKNNGRASGGNPAERDLREYQQDEVKQHSHSTVQMIQNNDIDGVDSTTTHSGEHHNERRETGAYGGMKLDLEM